FNWSVAHLDLPSFPTRRSSDLFLVDLYSSRWPSAATVAQRSRRDCISAALIGRKSRAIARFWCSTCRESIPLIVVATGRLIAYRSEEHTSELQSPYDLVCRLLL